MPTIHDDPKSAAEAYLVHLETSYYEWYEKSVRRNYILWLSCSVLGMSAGFGTSVVAALKEAKLFEGLIASWTLVGLPFLGALAASVAVQSRVYDRWRLREEGRCQFQSLVTKGRRRFASALSEADYSSLHKDLQEEADAIEAAQSKSFFAHTPPVIK